MAAAHCQLSKTGTGTGAGDVGLTFCLQILKAQFNEIATDAQSTALKAGNSAANIAPSSDAMLWQCTHMAAAHCQLSKTGTGAGDVGLTFCLQILKAQFNEIATDAQSTALKAGNSAPISRQVQMQCFGNAQHTTQHHRGLAAKRDHKND
jgi:hypothetical protein